MSDIQRRFGQAVRSTRKRSGISQEELASRSELHRTYISDIERGSRNPSLLTMVRLASALGVTLGELVTLSEVESPA